jgi:hypothetical protein
MAYDQEDMVSFPTRLFHYALFGTLMSGAIEVYLANLDYHYRILMNLMMVAAIIKQEIEILNELTVINKEKIEAEEPNDDEAPIHDGPLDYGDQRLLEPHLAEGEEACLYYSSTYQESTPSL